MEFYYPYILLVSALLVITSIIAGRFFARLGFSTLLVTLLTGILFGNGGRFDFEFNYPGLTLHISEIALCFIIFSGGFESKWNLLKPFLSQGISLATLGVILTTCLVGISVYFILEWDILSSLLIGAIVSATDAAAVFSILESSQVRLKKGLSEILQLESGTNDPMAYFLTISLTQLCLLKGQGNYGMLAFDFVKTMSLGFLSGYLVAFVIYWLIIKARLKKGQNPVILIAAVILIYALNSLVGGSAFLAVYVAGIYLGNKKWSNQQFNIHFFEGFSWLMETLLFLILGLQVNIFTLDDFMFEGFFISAVLLFIARPVATHASLMPLKGFSWKTAGFISWVGLRGATPLVFALIPVVNHLPEAGKLVNIALYCVATSIILQGTMITKLASLFNVEEEDLKGTGFPEQKISIK
ncbi:MAG TPA: potassium/proton antiporter [Flavobacteriales bacterium]|nr:potassium/proton antiporter [Flavobacteriales bacterium]